MKSIRIFVEEPLSAQTELELEQSASNHLLKVLRLKEGDGIILFNGDGNEYYSHIEIVKGKKALISVDSSAEVNLESPLKLSLCQGLAKNDKMDLAIQKATELGICSVTPIITERTQFTYKGNRLEKKLQHWQKIIISACEQSGRTVLPQLNPPVAISDFLQQQKSGFILDPYSSASVIPTDNSGLSELKNSRGEIDILIGPEGGFTDNEVKSAKENGMRPLVLGKRILRTETAAMAAIIMLQTLFGDFG